MYRTNTNSSAQNVTISAQLYTYELCICLDKLKMLA